MQPFAPTIALAYSADNQATADQLQQDLAGALQFETFAIERDQAQSLAMLLADFEGPIFLLISDNFLRSTKCMEGGLSFVSAHNEDILPIIIPGHSQDAKGAPVAIPTHFKRVADIIKYINHWQDRYLELRRQKREDKSLDNEGFAKHLRAVRAISAESGEHIRILRSLDPVNWEELRTEKYASLFEFLGEDELGEAFQAQFEGTILTETIVTPPVEAPAVEEEELPTVEEPPVDLGAIPGAAALGITPISESTVDETDDAVEDFLEQLEQEAAEEEEPVEKTTPSETLSSTPIPTEEITSTARAATISSIDDVIQQAWDLVEKEQSSVAIDLLESALQRHPESLDLGYNHALLLAQERRMDAAQTAVNAVLKLHPTHAPSHFLAGELADSIGDAAQAKKLYLQTVALNEDLGEAWLQLGLLGIVSGADIPKTVEYLKKAAKKMPTDSESTYQLGVLYANSLDLPAKALKYFKKTLEREPQHPLAHYEIAVLQHQASAYDEAQAAYQQAIINNANLQTPANDLAFATPIQTQQIVSKQQDVQSLKAEVARLEALLAQQSTANADFGPAKTVLITGATAGIGRATAKRFAQAGHRLIITGRRAERLLALKKEWEAQYPTKIQLLIFDVRDAKAGQKAIDQLPDEWKNIDILVNNAGKAKGFDPIHEGQIEHWEEMIDTNVKGLLYLTRAISPGMVARGSGHIINVASTAGKEVYPKGNVYCATKFAVDALTKGMRMDLHQHGVRVSQVAPAHVEETEFAVVRFDGDTERAKIYEDFQPLTSSNVADTIYYIAQQPAHVNILDVVLQGTQQAHSMIIDRSGREKYQEEE